MTEYAAWSPADIESLILEAAQTLMLCPNVRGPKAFGSNMPEAVRLARDAYGADGPRIRKLPDPAALDRMETIWGWVNELPDEDIRRALYGSSAAKIRRRDSIKKFATRSKVSYRTIRRRFELDCSQIADNLNKKQIVRLTVSAFSPKSGANHLPSKKYELHWREPGSELRTTPEVRRDRRKNPNLTSLAQQLAGGSGKSHKRSKRNLR